MTRYWLRFASVWMVSVALTLGATGSAALAAPPERQVPPVDSKLERIERVSAQRWAAGLNLGLELWLPFGDEQHGLLAFNTQEAEFDPSPGFDFRLFAAAPGGWFTIGLDTSFTFGPLNRPEYERVIGTDMSFSFGWEFLANLTVHYPNASGFEPYLSLRGGIAGMKTGSDDRTREYCVTEFSFLGVTESCTTETIQGDVPELSYVGGAVGGAIGLRYWLGEPAYNSPAGGAFVYAEVGYRHTIWFSRGLEGYPGGFPNNGKQIDDLNLGHLSIAVGIGLHGAGR